MKIGNVELPERALFLAPMEDVTDPSFRYMCKRFGADMVTNEFISSDGLIRDARKSLAKLNISDFERPVGIQIYGNQIEPMVEAAKIAEGANPDVIDINFGCPMKKIAGRGAGSGMMRDVPLMVEMTRQIVNAVKKPVTVKTRLGWDDQSKHRGDSTPIAGCGYCSVDNPRSHSLSTLYGRSRLDFNRKNKERSNYTYTHYRQRRCRVGREGKTYV